jgi:nucleotide-binding universal stress UspA family protein
MKRILASVDHSEPSLRAAELAAEMARKFGAELVLLTAARWFDRPDPLLEKHLQAEHISDPISVVIADTARSELKALSDRLATGLSHPISCEVVVGSAADAIISFARESAIDLIAIGHVGHGRLGNLVLGSVAKRVIDAAPCPVMVVR